jgi:hypothetical protein
MSQGRKQAIPNQFDGLIHVSGRAFDPTNGKEVEFDDSSNLQWHG